MENCQRFELGRLIDGLTYRFDRLCHVNGEIGYKRQDKDLWIVNAHGWVAWNFETGEVQGRPWHIILDEQQAVQPPELNLTFLLNEARA